MTVLTLEQAAEYLQISPDDLQNELEQGRVPGRKLAGKWRISRDALDRFLSQSEMPGQPKAEGNAQVNSGANLAGAAKDFEGPSSLEYRQAEEHKEPASEASIPVEQSVVTPESNSTAAIEESASLFSGITTLKEAENTIDATETPSGHTSVSASVEETGRESAKKTAQLQQSTAVQNPPSLSSRGSASGSNRIVARIFMYNQREGFGYARMTDNNTILIDSKHLVSPHPTPFPGDVIEFEWHLSKKGKQQPRAIRVLANNEASADTEKHEKQSDSPQQEALQPITPNPSDRAPVFESPQVRRSYTNPGGTKEAQQLYQRAALANTEGRYDEARKLFRKALDAGAGVQAYVALAKLERESGSKAEAFRILKQAINVFPNQANFYIMYGQMERSERNYKRAEEIFREGLKYIPNDAGLRLGLAQVLVQIGSETTLSEAGEIFASLDREGKVQKNDGLYQRFQFLQRNPRANQVYDFFQTVSGMRVGIAGQKGLPQSITDIVVEIDNQELQESFGLSGGILVRCFQRPARQAEIVNLKNYISNLRNNELVGLREGREVVLNRSLAFIAVPDTGNVRDQIMNILSESSEAIVPIDDTVLKTRDSENVLSTLRDLLGQYLGQRDLYNSTGPVYGVPGRRFFGRERLLVQLADDVSRGQFIGIYGLRKMGKTSLVYQLRDEKLRGDAVAYVDLQASDAQITRNFAPLYYELERDLYVRLSKRDVNAASLLRLGKYDRFSALSQDSNTISLTFAEDMRAILDEISEGKISSIKRIVIVLDELERILPVSGQGGVQGYLEFFGLIRGLMQTERYRGLLSSVVVAANASISERGYWEDRENPVFALYKTVFLPPFSKDECDEMIKTLGRGMSIRWEDDAVATVFSETGGHPFLTRLFCSRIIQHYRTRPLLVTVDMIKEQINPFIRSEGDKMEQITELLHRNFPEEEQYLLQIALGEALEDLPDDALRHLVGYHLIQADRNRYRITLNLLRRWLRRRAGVKDE